MKNREALCPREIIREEMFHRFFKQNQMICMFPPKENKAFNMGYPSGILSGNKICNCLPFDEI
jgi:hypothetical protein